MAPALLTLWVRASVAEPEGWKQARARSALDGQLQPGSLRELLTDRRWAGRTLAGTLLAAVGLATFWSVTVAGQDLAKEVLLEQGVAEARAAARSKFAYGVVATAGGGLGLLALAPLSVRVGRRGAFAIMQLGALAVVPATCYLPADYTQLLCWLPAFGLLTLGMHAGFAIYFPELFPTHLRATGNGFCFNVGRILAAPMLFFSGWLKAQDDVDLRLAITLLGLVFVLGLLCLLFLPETKGRPLPE